MLARFEHALIVLRAEIQRCPLGTAQSLPRAEAAARHDRNGDDRLAPPSEWFSMKAMVAHSAGGAIQDGGSAG